MGGPRVYKAISFGEEGCPALVPNSFPVESELDVCDMLLSFLPSILVLG